MESRVDLRGRRGRRTLQVWRPGLGAGAVALEFLLVLAEEELTWKTEWVMLYACESSTGHILICKVV